MTIAELKEKVEKHREGCEKKNGVHVSFSKTGPAGMAMIDVLVAVIETQEKRIAALEEKCKGFVAD